ncbi:MAG: hypothetical protein ABTQ31_08765, partial [Rhizobiaceae bacterium]
PATPFMHLARKKCRTRVVLIELKRDKTPRDVVAQSLDYVSSVEKLRADDIAAIYGRFAPSRNLGEDFQQRFGLALDEDSLNESHQITLSRPRSTPVPSASSLT